MNELFLILIKTEKNECDYKSFLPLKNTTFRISKH